MSSATRLVPVILGLAAACSAVDQTAPPNPDLHRAAPTVAASCKPAPPDSLNLLPIAPRSRRVDLDPPVFSRPTEVTNPLYPIKTLEHVVLVGLVDGERFRAETTLLPATKTIQLDNGSIQTLTSQYVAFLDGRLLEVALDWYAQDDAGNVWYLGEDVFNYVDGKVANTHGTWQTCRDGPPAMIMPARPARGQVFRVENIYPLVFEEIEIVRTGEMVDGPLGRVAGAITVQQLHLDSTYAPKTFAPGYGEFSTGSGQDFEALAVAVPTDNARGKFPASLEALLEGSDKVIEAAAKGSWNRVDNTLRRIQSAWSTYRSAGLAPRLLAPIMASAVESLVDAAAKRDADATVQAGIDVARVALDLAVRHQSRAEVDLSRLEIFVRQLSLDASVEDQGGVRGTLVTMGLILDRLGGGDRRLDGKVRQLRSRVAATQAANERGDFKAVARGAEQLDRTLDR